jgi:predicted nucleic acid-binding protein
LSAYLDASVLVALFVDDVFTERADAFLRRSPAKIVVSDFAAAEFASSVSRKVRMGRLSEADAREAFATFDMWAARAAERIGVVASDVGAATHFLRRLDLTLRTADAINIAMAERLGAELASFDQKMVECAAAVGVPAVVP